VVDLVHLGTLPCQLQRFFGLPIVCIQIIGRSFLGQALDTSPGWFDRIYEGWVGYLIKGWWVIIHNPFCLYFGHISVLEDTFIPLFYLFRLDSRVLLFRIYRFVYLFRLDRRILLLSFIYSGSTAVCYYILYRLFSSARTPYI